MHHPGGQSGCWRVVQSGDLDEWASVMPTALGLPIKSADRIRTKPSPFQPSPTAVRKSGTKTAVFDDRIRTQPSIPPIKRAAVRRNGTRWPADEMVMQPSGGSGRQRAPKTSCFHQWKRFHPAYLGPVLIYPPHSTGGLRPERDKIDASLQKSARNGTFEDLE